MTLFSLINISSLDHWIIWLALLILFVIIELSTVMLLTIWFAGGALMAMIASLLGANIVVQTIVFIVFSAISLAIGWRYRTKLNVGRFGKTATNADRLIGQRAVVTLAINPLLGQGQVKVAGLDWSAVSASDDVIPVGEHVRILEIRGVKLIVEQIPLDDVKEDAVKD